jgi:primosomal protein N' (replication factor Y)
MFVKVAFPIPYVEYFTYRIPNELQGYLQRGTIVTAPFGSQSAAGVVLDILERADFPDEHIREISAIGDPDLSVPMDVFDLAVDTARYYGTTAGMVFKSALPPGTFLRKKLFFYPGIDKELRGLNRVVRDFVEKVWSEPGRWSFAELRQFEGIERSTADSLIRTGTISVSPFRAGLTTVPAGKERWLRATTDVIPENIKPHTKAYALLSALISSKDGIRSSTLKDQGFSPSSAATLRRRGLVEFEYRDKGIGDIGSLKSLREDDVLELTLWQRAALEKIEAALDSDGHRGFLLYGVTSSGKTQVYLEAARYAIERGKSVLVLVPEITLTPQIISRFERFLGFAPLVWHSQMSASDRVLVYRRARAGKGRLVIGARSAVFCPLENPGLIVVDEEQDSSFKQDDPAPRYNARDLAIKRGKLTAATVVLGSATPSMESYHQAREGRLGLLTLPQRVAGRADPRIEIISTARGESGLSSSPVFPEGFWPVSESLFNELSIRLKNKEQVIILLNRRGYSSSVVCFDCGWLGKCPDCDIGWTYYKSRSRMICHFCGQEKKGPTVCPVCGSGRLSFRGAGTERLEETLSELLPKARIRRLDSDVASGRWRSRDILDDFGRGKFDILLGTQMVAKGHHFPSVEFVAVIGADTGLSLPDFRASERVLQLLIQAAGRAGRSGTGNGQGLVMVQTYSPGTGIFQALKEHDYMGFLEDEIQTREKLYYPPFSRLVQVVVSSSQSAKALKVAGGIKDDSERISADMDIVILGPARSPLFRRGKQYRYQLLYKVRPDAKTDKLLDCLNGIAREARGYSVRIDVDPVGFI